MEGYGFQDLMFSSVPGVILLIFVVVGGVIIFTLVKGVRQWSINNHAIREVVLAHVVTKRTEVSGGGGNTRANTSYYVTFEMANRDRTEFSVRSGDYGMLVEGDAGILTYQGTRYIGFERQDY